MRIVIAGAGSVGRYVALELLEHGHEVTLIDNNPDQMKVASVKDADWVLGDACAPEVLADAGVADADVLVAATGDDKANLVISLLTKIEFAISRVIARINNPKNEWLFNDSWGVDVPVSTPRITTALVEEAISEGTPVRIFQFNRADVSLFSISLPETSPLIGKRCDDIPLPNETVLAAMLRGKVPLPAQPSDVLKSGDELLILVPGSHDRDKTQDDLNSLVNERPEKEA